MTAPLLELVRTIETGNRSGWTRSLNAAVIAKAKDALPALMALLCLSDKRPGSTIPRWHWDGAPMGGGGDLHADDQGELVRFEDHQTGLAAVMTENDRLKGFLNEIAMMGIPFRHDQAAGKASLMKSLARHALAPDKYKNPLE